jgi:hypothetical protein
VTFRQANLMEPDVLEPQAYDLICCRNLLLYQSTVARRHMAAQLAGSLAEGGRLIVGAADWGCDLDDFFRLEIPIHSFALRLRDSGASAPASPAKEAKQLPKEAFVKSDKSETILPSSALPLEAATRQLADVTDLYRRALETYLRGDELEAEKLCRKTLYLEPDHIPSLELLSKLERPHVTQRVHQALHARLRRHRAAVPAGGSS